jgi:hypothetical protein
VFSFTGNTNNRLKSSLIAPSGDIYMIIEDTSHIIAKLNSTYHLQWAKQHSGLTTYDMAIALSGNGQHLFFSELGNPVVINKFLTSDGSSSVYSA